ncbi:GATOR complex protein WDR24 [Aphelenchoides besseyi]|nr:GATOR complex protein WDR24 [Aphelenchoides besseyi]KAI6212055.1 GATOR complex protein WDR24 [Aphelenchoides besseyi]
MTETDNDQSVYVVQNVVHDVGEAMDALSTNKNFDLVAVAGRSVMKLYAIRDNKFEQVLDLRTKTCGRNVYFSGSISWNSVKENLIAATSSTGSIVVFDLDHCRGLNSQDTIRFIDPGAGSSDHLFRANKAAATKVCFHSFNPYLFVSGSRDATLWLHDYRQLEPAASFVVQGGSIDSIRDLQFCLDSSHQDYFVTGDDSGTVRFWDLRYANAYLKEFIGNTRQLSSLALNRQSWNLLLTGGLDRFVRIWDWSLDSPETIQTIETPTTVGRVEWDTSSRYHFATATNLHDHRLLMWDYRRPAFPFMTFRSHDSNVSDIAFPQNPNPTDRKFVSCGRDRKLILHYTEFGDSTVEAFCPSISMAIGPDNEIFSAVPRPYLNGNLVAELDFTKPVTSTILNYLDDEVPIFNDPESLINYRFKDDHPVRICNWNSHITKKLGNYHLAYTWSIIGILLQQAGICIPPVVKKPKDRYFEFADPDNPFPQSSAAHDDDERSNGPDSDDELETGAFNQNFQETLSSEADLFYGIEEFGNMEMIPGGSRFLDFIQQNREHLMKIGAHLNDDAIFVKSNENDENSDSESELTEQNISSETAEEDEDDNKSSTNSGSVSPALNSERMVPLETESIASGASDGEHRKKHGNSEYEVPITETSALDSWGPLSVLKRIMNAYSDVCDSQTCATVCFILGKLAIDLFGEDQVSAWCFHYIEMLQDAGNNELATLMAKQCGLQEVIKSIQENMHVKFFCANCQTATPSGQTSCEKCGTSFATVCTVCDHACKGLFSQCNECGHGGHAKHLEEWFRTFGICAFPGCEHLCVPVEAFETEEPPEPSQTSDGVAVTNKLLFSGNNVYVDADENEYYRAEDGEIKPLPDLFPNSFSRPLKRRTNKYSIDL